MDRDFNQFDTEYWNIEGRDGGWHINKRPKAMIGKYIDLVE